MSQVFARLIISKILNNIVARIIASEVERYGKRSADKLSQKAVIDAIPDPLYNELKINATRVAYGYVMLILGGILALIGTWSFTVFGFGPPFFGILSLGWTLVSLAVIIHGARSVDKGNKTLRGLTEEITNCILKTKIGNQHTRRVRS